MSKKKRRAGWVQNLAILCLSLSAVFLLVRVFSYEYGEDGLLPTLNTIFSAGSVASGTGQATDLTGMAAPFNLVATAPYGRYGRMLASSADGEAVHASNLLRETLGSATGETMVQEEQFRAALEQTSLFLDYLTPLPASILGDWFGADFTAGFDVRYLLIAAEDGAAVLYLWDGTGAIYRYATAVEAGTLEATVEAFRPEDVAVSGDVVFAFEDPEQYGHLCPYTVLSDESRETAVLTAAIPALAGDVEQLLSMLDFNPHTANRYTQTTTGTEEVVESPRHLWVQTDGVVIYQGDTETVSPLFHISCAEETPTEAEAVLAVRQLAEKLLEEEILSASDVYLSGIQGTEDGFWISFDYLVDGIPVYFSDGTSALEVETTGDTITGFRLKYRQYASNGATYQLLPLEHAVHMATTYRNALLTKGYVDRDEDTITADWLLR